MVELSRREQQRTTYIVGAQVGAGNFGIVWHCTDPFGTDQVVKVLKPLQPIQYLRERALAEVQKAFYLRHPNIKYVYDYFEHRDTLHIVYERCGLPLDLEWPRFRGRFSGWRVADQSFGANSRFVFFKRALLPKYACFDMSAE